jgi:hypothetical protein
MKKNKWLLMLAAIVLLATCLFAGLAMADDAGTGNGVVEDTVWPETKSDKYTVTLNYVGPSRTNVAPATNGAPFINAVPYTDRGYYAGEIYINWDGTQLPADKKNPDTGDIQIINLTLKYNNNQFVGGDQYKGEDIYFKFSSSNARVIFPAPLNKEVKATDLKGVKNGKFSLNLMTIDEMIGELYNPNQVITNADGTMIPGSAVITVTPYTSADGGKTFKPIPNATPAQFVINVKPVTWTNVTYTPSDLVHKEADGYTLYLQELQDKVPNDQDTGFYFPIEQDATGKGLGKFPIQPFTATYKKLHFDIDNTDVANITSDFKDIVIKQTGEFTLIVSDEDGYTTKAGKGPWQFKFIVKDAALTGYPIQSVNFTYDQFTRKVGEYLDLNKYVYMIRKDQLGQHMTEGTLFKQVLKHGSGTDVFAKDAKYAKTYYTIWQKETVTGYGTNYPYVNDRKEKFTVEWTSSNPKVAVVVNKEDLYKDSHTSGPWYYGSWNPANTDVDQSQVVTYVPGTSGDRLVWYSTQDHKYILPNQGYVLMLSGGKTTITVKVTDQGSGAFYTASTTITVKGDPAASAPLTRKIKLNFAHNPKVMYVGDKDSINEDGDITVKPTGASTVFAFSSSNKKVVKVSKDGVLTARKPGTAVITVSATDGSGVEKSFTVEVRERKEK